LWLQRYNIYLNESCNSFLIPVQAIEIIQPQKPSSPRRERG
jgi:hypothetical protein